MPLFTHTGVVIAKTDRVYAHLQFDRTALSGYNINMATRHYRRIMGIVSALISIAAFTGALILCVLLCVAADVYVKAVLLPPLIVVSFVAVISVVFSVFNIGSKTGIIALIVSICAAVCLIVAYTQL